MVDVSNMTLSTPVKVIIRGPSGVWIPELSTYTPLESYASVEQVINMMNRGLYPEFPKQSSQKEITNKIEELLLDYHEKLNKANEKCGYEVAPAMDTALDTIQEINDTKLTRKEEVEELNKNLFYIKDIELWIIRNLSDNNFDRVFDSDEFVTPEERVKNADKLRKATERMHEMRNEALKDHALENETYMRYASGINESYEFISGIYGELELDSNLTTPFQKKKKK